MLIATSDSSDLQRPMYTRIDYCCLFCSDLRVVVALGGCPFLKVRTFDEHEESVYSLAWSASDAWVLASLSYDGQIVLNHVPSTEKYKILL